MLINVDEGTELIPVLGNGMHTHESEFIIPEGTKTIVKNVSEDAETGYPIIELMVVSD